MTERIGWDQTQLLRDEVAALRRENERLAEEIEEYRRLLGLNRPLAEVVRIR